MSRISLFECDSRKERFFLSYIPMSLSLDKKIRFCLFGRFHLFYREMSRISFFGRFLLGFCKKK